MQIRPPPKKEGEQYQASIAEEAIMNSVKTNSNLWRADLAT